VENGAAGSDRARGRITPFGRIERGPFGLTGRFVAFAPMSSP
jgi:hypothetical protein